MGNTRATSSYDRRTTMFVKILGVAMLSAMAFNAAAGPMEELPRSESQVLQVYPEAVKLRDGVYTVKRGEQSRTFLFGGGGALYHAEYLSSMRKMMALQPDADPAALATLDQSIGRLQKLGATLRAKSPRSSKNYDHSDVNMCGWRTWVDVGYIGGWTSADGFAKVDMIHDGVTGSVGTPIMGAYVFKYNNNGQQYSQDVLNAPGSARASIVDTFGGIVCDIDASAGIEFPQTPSCDPDYSGWFGSGPCV